MMINARLTTLVAACGILSSLCFAQNAGSVAICPWTFGDGNKTSRETVMETIGRIAEHHGLRVLPQDDVDRRYESLRPAVAFRNGMPIFADLARYASEVQADTLIYGNASWHTRSVWVGTGPKTISTATVDLYVFDARTRKVTYKRKGAQGRSDEKESTLKVVGDVLLTPLITVVSGGPATPREQRAVQIALGRAFEPWVHREARAR